MNELVNKCYSCEFHRQDCTFSLANSALTEAASPQSRKRKLEDFVEESTKRFVSFSCNLIDVNTC